MLRDRWVNVDETWHSYSVGLLLGSGILNFGPCNARGHPELSLVAFSDSLYRTLQLRSLRNQRPAPLRGILRRENLTEELAARKFPAPKSPVGRDDPPRVG